MFFHKQVLSHYAYKIVSYKGSKKIYIKNKNEAFL